MRVQGNTAFSCRVHSKYYFQLSGGYGEEQSIKERSVEGAGIWTWKLLGNSHGGRAFCVDKTGGVIMKTRLFPFRQVGDTRSQKQYTNLKQEEMILPNNLWFYLVKLSGKELKLTSMDTDKVLKMKTFRIDWNCHFFELV